MKVNDDGSTTFRYIGLHASPDKWGFMRTDEFSGTCFFACNRGCFRI